MHTHRRTNPIGSSAYSLEVMEHVGSAEQHGRGVGDVPAYSLGKGVPRSLRRRGNVYFQAILHMLIVALY